MNLTWAEHKNRFGSIELWSVCAPIGVWMDIHPIIKGNQIFYRIDNARIEGVAEYSTLDRTKEVCEELYLFINQHPSQRTDIDLRNHPEFNLQFYDATSTQVDYSAQLVTSKKFIPPIK